ncbi:MAG: hypothetical protein ABL958_10035 [Bdellovibrionia bacterium]
MNKLILIVILLLAPKATARNQYFAMFVPMSLQNLGYSSANSWVGDCANCHRTAAGGQVGVPDLNAMFGRDFYAFVANTGSDFLQPQVQMMIQGIEGLDSDNDGATNLQEYRGRTNPNNPLSKPAVAGSGDRNDDPADFFPPGENSSASMRVVSSEETYALSGCGVDNGTARAQINGGIPFSASSSIAGLWLLPILLVLFERRRIK